MAHAVELSVLGAGGDVDWALGHAAVHGRFATGISRRSCRPKGWTPPAAAPANKPPWPRAPADGTCWAPT
jgi:hypothetical protein